MVSTDDLQEVVDRLFKESIIGPLKSKMAEICDVVNGHDVIFSAERGPIWIKFCRLVQTDIYKSITACSFVAAIQNNCMQD